MGFGGSTKYNPKKLTFYGNIYHFRVFYLESASPELKESSIIMKIGFKFAKIEYFQNLQESVENIYLPFKYCSLKSTEKQVQAAAKARCARTLHVAKRGGPRWPMVAIAALVYGFAVVDARARCSV